MIKYEFFLGIDIGGSHISGALVDSKSGKIVNDSTYEIKVDSTATSDVIIQSWKKAIHHLLSNKIDGMGISIPGPFDYKRGISMIEGVQKFEAIFGQNIKEELRTIFNDRNKPIAFINDAAGFALGEYYAGAAQGDKRSLIVTLGTGFGSTFLIDGIPQQKTSDAIPANGYLYNIPFGKSIADDYFSTRWFAQKWQEKTGEFISGAKEVAQYAADGNATALNVFDEFSVNLSDFIYPWLQKFRPDTFVIGGNIAKASKFFLDKLIFNLQAKGITNTQIKICKLWDEGSIVGAAMNLKSLVNKTEMDKQRKTEQFLAPEKTQQSKKGDYDIYPAFPVGSGKIREGAEALATWIAQHKQVVIDGYVGVFWDQLIESLSIELDKKGKKVHWFHTDAAMRSPQEIDEMIAPYLGGNDPIFGKVTDKKLKDWFDENKLKQIKPDSNDDINILIGCGAALAGWDAPLIYIDLPKNELQFRMRADVITNLGAEKPEDNRQMYKRFYFVDWIVLNEHKCRILPKIDLIVDEQRPDALLFMEGNDLRQGLSDMSRNFFRVRPWFEPGAWGGSWMKEHIKELNPDVPNLAWSFELMVLENGLMFESDNYRLEVTFDFIMFNNYKEVLGDCAERFQYDFPIRFDFLDTFDGGNLSVQCHPRPEYIKKEFGMPFTQDETYYILDCKEKPVVYLGFQEGINPDEFHKALIYSQENSKELDINKYVQSFIAKKHDLFLIPNGTIHASGKDNLVLEISSSPYIFTFKMYDWLRLDLDGRPRPINIEHGMNNLYFDRQGKKVEEELICKPYIIEQTNDYTLEHLPTHRTQFYDVHRYNIETGVSITTNNKCHVWMLVEGSSVIVETADGKKQRFNYAETFVIPAAAQSYKIINEGKEKALMLMSFVK